MRGWWQRRSLRGRLTMVATGAVAVGLLFGALALALGFAHSRVGQLDGTVRGQAAVVEALVASDSLPDVLPIETGAGGLVQVLDHRGRVVAASLSASGTLAVLTPAQLAGWPRNTPRSYRDRQLTGLPLRIEVVDGRLRGEPVAVVSAVPLTAVLETLGALRAVLFAVVPLLVLAVGVGSWLLCGSALRPVDDLRRGAEAIGAGGVLPVPPGGDEIARLGGTLNRMLGRLAAAGVRQRAFIADAAHELRSPLASLRTQLEVAVAHPSPSNDRALLPDLLAEVLRLGRLVDDLLILARLDEEQRPIHTTPVDVAALARDVAAGEQRVPIGVTGEGRAEGDAVALRRVLVNLLDNAVRHAASRVVVTVEPGRVVVADDGPGVPAGDRERIFERFTRLDDARARDAGGSGLGLAIAREIARAGGGDLTVTESDLGGAAFALRTVVSRSDVLPADVDRARRHEPAE